MAEFADYAWLIDDPQAATLLARLAAEERPALEWLALLRRELPAERARLVVSQAELRRRAAAKFGDDARRMYFTPVLLEQATDRWIARYKATRFRNAGTTRVVHDYCCGIGGDFAALASSGPSAGWDQSEVACLLSRANVAAVVGPGERHDIAVRQASVEQLTPLSGEAWHLDPDRRSAGRRTTTIEDHAPGPAEIERLRRCAADGAVKLAPATAPPAQWTGEAELEWISSRRECRQLVAWFGGLATDPGQRRATVVADDNLQVSLATFAGTPGVRAEATDEPLRYVYDPDPAVLAAGLLGALAAKHGLRSLGAGGAYLAADEPIDAPLVQAFAVRACVPLRTRVVAELLAAGGVGRVEIKQRGVAVDVESFRRGLKLRGDAKATLLLTRIGKRQVALVADRLAEGPDR